MAVHREARSAKPGACREVSPSTEVDRVIGEVLLELGTVVSAESSLMGTGLDSIAATELSRIAGERLNMELPSTLLFDHPTRRTMVSVIGHLQDCVLS